MPPLSPEFKTEEIGRQISHADFTKKLTELFGKNGQLTGYPETLSEQARKYDGGDISTSLLETTASVLRTTIEKGTYGQDEEKYRKLLEFIEG